MRLRSLAVLPIVLVLAACAADEPHELQGTVAVDSAISTWGDAATDCDPSKELPEIVIRDAAGTIVGRAEVERSGIITWHSQSMVDRDECTLAWRASITPGSDWYTFGAPEELFTLNVEELSKSIAINLKSR